MPLPNAESMWSCSGAFSAPRFELFHFQFSEFPSQLRRRGVGEPCKALFAQNLFSLQS